MKREDDLKRKGILILKKPDEEKEIEFEIDHLLSLSLEQRISMMRAKSKELKTNLEKNGHRKTPQIIKRK